ncbi:MAG TPA: hypothetical protein VNN18_06660 [Candidatus Xenobia bacterium]|nr:hypothetical protein [Candidatus Xenobia bacterium]
MATSRTVLDFPYSGDLWAIVEKWANENGYRRKEGDDTRRLYQKGTGFLVAPMMLELQRQGDQTHLEAWIRCNIFTRLMSFFILPAEMGIESGGFRAVVPRNMARGAVNKLLPQLGQPLIN